MKTGEKSLKRLLAQLAPSLLPQAYVFCTFKGAHYADFSKLKPLVSVEEAQGLTLVVSQSVADQHQLDYASVFRCITLKVHSSLDAVGLTAAISGELARHGISANMVAGYFHGPVFVQAEEAQRALAVINKLNEVATI